VKVRKPGLHKIKAQFNNELFVEKEIEIKEEGTTKLDLIVK